MRLSKLEEVKSQLRACSNAKEMVYAILAKKELWFDDQLCIPFLLPGLWNHRNKINAGDQKGLTDEVNYQANRRWGCA